MRATRIIPRLDIKGPALVKGVHLEGLRVLGRPEAFARFYYESGADELIYIDAVASLYARNSLLDVVSRTSAEVFIPLTVGGGLRTVDDIHRALTAGADKVALNTAAIRTPELIREAARRFGSSAIVVNVEAIETAPGKYEAFTNSGREATGVNAIEWAQRAADLGAGEILLTSVDRDGTGKGFDVRLTAAVASAVSVPVIASGGAGTRQHVAQVVDAGRADAVAIASMLHYGAVDHLPRLLDLPEGNVEFLRSGRPPFKTIHPCTIGDVAATLAAKGWSTRSTMAAWPDRRPKQADSV